MGRSLVFCRVSSLSLSCLLLFIIRWALCFWPLPPCASGLSVQSGQRVQNVIISSAMLSGLRALGMAGTYHILKKKSLTGYLLANPSLAYRLLKKPKHSYLTIGVQQPLLSCYKTFYPLTLVILPRIPPALNDRNILSFRSRSCCKLHSPPPIIFLSMRQTLK